MYSDPKWIHWISSESFSGSVSLHLAVAFYSKEYQTEGLANQKCSVKTLMNACVAEITLNRIFGAIRNIRCP